MAGVASQANWLEDRQCLTVRVPVFVAVLFVATLWVSRCMCRGILVGTVRRSLWPGLFVDLVWVRVLVVGCMLMSCILQSTLRAVAPCAGLVTVTMLRALRVKF